MSPTSAEVLQRFTYPHPPAPDPLPDVPGVEAEARLQVGDRMLLALSDGYFAMPTDFIGTREEPTAAHDHLAAEHGRATLPIGAFLLPGERTTLLDLGVGPFDFGGGGWLVGGRLLRSLARHGLQPQDVDVIAVSHLHADHIGWLATLEGEPVFPRATVMLGREDWEFFVEGDESPMTLDPHVRAALDTLGRQGRLELLDGDVQIAPGLTRLHAPGHTPGHSIYVVHDAGERALLLGDAMYCPLQVAHRDWDAMSDVDVGLARRTREAQLRALDEDGGLALGCHFPGLRAGRVVGGAWDER